MELRQLEYFVAVAEEANFTRAAERVHISQSGVSAQVRQLERELGATLIDRSSRTAALTPAGLAALGPARAALGAVDAVRRAVDEVSGLLRGQLMVGMVTACTVTPLFDALGAFHRAHPGVEVSLAEDTSDRLVARLRAGELHLALIGWAGEVPTDLCTLPVISEPLAAAVPAGHPLLAGPAASRSPETPGSPETASSPGTPGTPGAPDGPLPGSARPAGSAPPPRSARLAEIVRHPVACLPPGTGIRAAFEQSCAALGLQPTVALTASAPAAVADLAVRGLAVAILSRSMIEGLQARHEGRLHAVELADAGTPAVLALAWAGLHNPALRALLDHARAAFARPAPPPRVEPRAAADPEKESALPGNRSGPDTDR